VLVGDILEDRGAFGEQQVAVLQERHLSTRVERGVWLLVVRAGEDVDELLLELDAMLRAEQADRTARRRDRMHVEFHGGPPASRPLDQRPPSVAVDWGTGSGAVNRRG